MKTSIKMTAKKALSVIILKGLENKLNSRDKEYCHMHPEWVDLTTEEKQLVDKRDLYDMKIFKNIYGFSKDFVSDAFYQCVLLPKLNAVNYNSFLQCDIRGYYEDKNYQDFFMADSVKTPKSVVRCVDGIFFDSDFNVLTEEEALETMNNYDALVFKTSMNVGHGVGVSKVEKKNYANEMKYRSGGSNYVVQEVIKQHPFLANFNSSSVNVIRITTVNISGKVIALSGILRVGPPGSFCDLLPNEGKHPLIVGLKDDGTLKDIAVDPDLFNKHDTVFGKKIAGQVPRYSEMKEIAVKAHSKFPKCGILGWDLTLDENEDIVFIEYNPGCPGVIQTQLVNGPVFKDIRINGKPFLDLFRK